MTELVPLADIEKMSKIVATSKMFGFKSPEEAMAIMLLCQAEGLHPAIAMRDYHVIQGRPTLKADAMLARFQQAGGRVKWLKLSDEEVSGTFSHVAGGDATITWTFAAAKKIGLTGKDSWVKYPRAMLRARVISEGIRTVYPGVVVGTYTPEEAQDMEQRQAPVDITPPVPVEEKVEVIRHESAKAQEVVSVPEIVPANQPPAEKPPITKEQVDDARAVYESVRVMVRNAKDQRDIDDALKSNSAGLKRLLAVSEPNYNKLKKFVEDRRFELVAPPAVDVDFETGEIRG